MIFIKLHPNVPHSETVCRMYDSATLTQGKGYTSRLWDSAAGDLAVLFMFLVAKMALPPGITCLTYAYVRKNQKI